MQIEKLKVLVQDGEGQLLEFKKKAAFPEKIAREMVAFANSRGGRLLIGVDDDGTISGLKFAEEEKFVVDRAITRHIRPNIRFQSEFIPISSKRSVLSYRIFESKKKPNYFLENPQEKGLAYVRISDKSIKASAEVVQILKGQNRKNGIRVNFGDKEKTLLQFLDKHGKITLPQFRSIAGLSRWSASKTLVTLVISNILEIVAGEKEDYYMVKQQH